MTTGKKIQPIWGDESPRLKDFLIVLIGVGTIILMSWLAYHVKL